jgi:hypothetical protein
MNAKTEYRRNTDDLSPGFNHASLSISNIAEVIRNVTGDRSIDLEIPDITVNRTNPVQVADIEEEPCILSGERILEAPEKLVLPDQATYLSRSLTTDSGNDTAVMIALSPPPRHKRLRKSQTHVDLRAANSPFIAAI